MSDKIKVHVVCFPDGSTVHIKDGETLPDEMRDIVGAWKFKNSFKYKNFQLTVALIDMWEDEYLEIQATNL